MGTWDRLSIKDKNDIIKVAVRNGISSLKEIKQTYNEFAVNGNDISYISEDIPSKEMDNNNYNIQEDNEYALGGNLFRGGGYVYDILPQLFALDGVPVTVTSGYRPGAVVAGTNRLSRHATHEAVDLRGDFVKMQHVLDNPNSHVARWLLANGYGYLNEAPTFGGTAKYWPKKYFNPDGTPAFHDHFHFGKDFGKQYAARFSRGPQQQRGVAYTANGWRNIAANSIMNNEGFRTMSYADAPKGKTWRSIGYGFNDSGFYGKYPQGISKYYDARGGITRAEAQQELNYMLDILEKQARSTYGYRWNQFNDNQKAAVIDVMYQRPGSAGKGSPFYKAIMAGDPNAVNYLGVEGFNNRNNRRRQLFMSSGNGLPQQTYPQNDMPAFMPLNEEALNAPIASYEQPIVIVNQPLEQAAQEYSEKELAAMERQASIDKFNTVWNLMSSVNQKTPTQSAYTGPIDLLTGNSNVDKWDVASVNAYGGLLTKPNIFDGYTENTGYMVNPKYWGNTKVKGEDVNIVGYRGGKGIAQYQDGEYGYVNLPDDYTQYLGPEVTVTNAKPNSGQIQAIRQQINKDVEDSRPKGAAWDIIGKAYDIAHTPIQVQTMPTAMTAATFGSQMPTYQSTIGDQASLAAGYATAPLMFSGANKAWNAVTGVTDAMAATKGGRALTAGLTTAMPWIDAGLTSCFGAHGLNDVKNSNADWMTALEVAPLIGPVAKIGKTAWNLGKQTYTAGRELVPKVNQFMASPYTGKWTTFGNKQYRFNPNSLGMNGVPIESRGTEIEFVPRITEENAASITPAQWTAAQDAAIIKGDVAEQQRLRNLHFIAKAQNTKILSNSKLPIHAYHGTGKKFNTFDTTGKYSTLDEGFWGVGAYFSPNRELASLYAETEKTPIIYDTYLNITNPLYHVRDYEDASLLGKIIKNNDGVISKLPEDLIDETFDMTEYVATKPNQIKLADAVTYDDNGIRIPLGDRDNFNINDMRYGLIPLGIGLTGYGLYNGIGNNYGNTH